MYVHKCEVSQSDPVPSHVGSQLYNHKVISQYVFHNSAVSLVFILPDNLYMTAYQIPVGIRDVFVQEIRVDK